MGSMRRWARAGLFLMALCVLASCGGVLAASPPVITRHPQPRVVVQGQTWLLEVAATGALRCQWRRNGVEIPGATGLSYLFHATTLHAGGVFDAAVTNEAGRVTSDSATIRVVTAQGPWNNGLWLVSGTDGRTWGPPLPFVGPAGVPSLARTPSGRLIAAFQWFPFDRPEAFDRLGVAFSDDGGATWSSAQPIQVQGLPAAYMRPFDPTVVALDDGRIRLYFTSNTGHGSENAFYSAISEDGVTYTWEPGVRFFPGRGTVDCAVGLWDGYWHLTSPVGAPHEGAYHAVSRDGLEFGRVADIPSSANFNWTGNLVATAHALRFYGTSPGGVWYSDSRDGTSWSPPVYVGVKGGDPAVVQNTSGLWLMLYVGPGF